MVKGENTIRETWAFMNRMYVTDKIYPAWKSVPNQNHLLFLSTAVVDSPLWFFLPLSQLWPDRLHSSTKFGLIRPHSRIPSREYHDKINILCCI
jgi:hypothetical protein